MNDINIMGKMTARTIAKNFLQYLSMIVITMLAVTLFCGFISNALTLKNHLEDYYEVSNLTDLICQYSPSVAAEDKTFLHSIDDTLVEYRVYSEGVVNQKSAKIFICAANNNISLPVLTSGTRGAVIDEHAAKFEEIEIGSKIQVELPFGSAELFVTGTMNFAETAETHKYIPIYVDYNYFFASIPVLSNFPQLWENYFNSYCNQALIKSETPQLVKNKINGHYNTVQNSTLVFVSDRDSMESVVMLNNEISQSIKMTYVFPVIFMLVSVLVILSTISPMILRERTNIGTLKSLGISNRKIFLHYSIFGAILCLIGGIIGIIIGPLIVPNVLMIKYSLVYSIPPFSGIIFSPVWSIVAILTVCLMAAIIGFAVCYKTIKEKPAECMRPVPPKENFILNKTCGKNVMNRPRNIPLKTASRNIIIKPSRAMMTVIGVAGCVALLVCSLGIGDTINNSVNFELGVQFSYDIYSPFAESSQVAFKDEMDSLIEKDEIEYYEMFKTFYMTAKGENVKDIKVYALPENPRLTTVNPSGKILITKSIAEDLKISRGDTIILSAAGKSETVVIDDIIENSFTKGIFVSDDGRFDEFYHTLGMWIKAPSASAELVDYINSVNGTNGAYSMSSMRESINTAISSIETIKLTLMLFSIALAVVVLYNLSLLNIKERQRDIATMKVLGFSTGQIGRSLLYEIMILVLIGTIIGLFLGYPVTLLVMGINRIEVLTFIYRIKPISYIISAAMSLATALIINLLFIRPIRKINMIESLKSVE